MSRGHHAPVPKDALLGLPTAIVCVVNVVTVATATDVTVLNSVVVLTVLLFGPVTFSETRTPFARVPLIVNTTVVRFEMLEKATTVASLNVATPPAAKVPLMVRLTLLTGVCAVVTPVALAD
jgi:hypothetical protein